MLDCDIPKKGISIKRKINLIIVLNLLLVIYTVIYKNKIANLQNL